ncbi:MAG TPA: sigma-70 family RNA polymerase sigma factor [Ktedonobacteraceae bacterium]
MTTALLNSSLSDLPSGGHKKPEEIPDDVLLQAFYYEQSDWAMEQLYTRYKPFLYGLAYRILRDSYLAEDVIQDVFITLWCKACSYQKELGSVKSWLQAIVRNRALDKVRSAMYREYQFERLEGIQGQDLASHEPEMWQRVWGGEQAHVIRKVLDELPPEQRQVIELNYFGGYSHTEIACKLEMPIGTIKGRIRLGLLKIKTHLRGYGIEASV